VRSIVYSGPIVSHATGGVSVTFTSQAVRDLPLASTAAELNIPEENEEDEASDGRSCSVSPQGTKRTRVAAQALANSRAEYSSSGNEQDSDQCSGESAVGIEPASMGANTGGKKKRRLHAAHTVLDIDASPASDFEGRLAVQRRGMSPKVTGSSPSYVPLAQAPGSRVSSAMLLPPQESKNPVLFTPVRTRSKNRLPTDVSPTDHLPEDKNESIFFTPMKMLNRLRHRKK
ncbi:hypothetical protein GGH92_003062, partial [Coemansia sp. RSA 2673]